MPVLKNVKITCEGCRFEHHLQRYEFFEGELVIIICHGCEMQLDARIPYMTPQEITMAMERWA